MRSSALQRGLRALLLAAMVGSLVMASAVPASAVKPIRDVPVRHTGHDYNDGQALPFGQGEKLNVGKPPRGPSKVGSVKTWLGLDDGDGTLAHPSRIYLKNYTLRGVGQHVEVWVANDLNFQAGDCRNNLLNGISRVTVTDPQVQYLIGEFDNNMYPIESAWWGVPPARDGHNAQLPGLIPNLPSSEYKGEGDNIVVLVDNVRDANYWNLNNTQTNPYIAGFYFSVFDDFFDRTVMSIDAFDWFHRTGIDPVHEPSSLPCTSAPARPFLYEGVFAHEYQHLIHRYTDPDETTWVNEGMSDFTMILTRYLDASKHVSEKGNDPHINGFLGWLSVAHPDWNPIPRATGPENGLTIWEDQGSGEIFEDYGFALFFMTLLNSQGLGQDFFHAWHIAAENGIDGLDTTLTGEDIGKTFGDLFRDVIVSALVDGYIDNLATVSGDAAAADLQNLATEATIFFSANANATPGAPPWGGDFIPLGDGSLLTSVAFDGDDVFNFPAGPQWVLDGGYFTNPDALGINYGSNQDLSIARSVAGHDGEILSFDHFYAMELGWDFGFVQVSTDDGDSWQSLGCAGTTLSHNPDALATITDNVPGYTGPSEDPAVPTTNGTAAAPLHATCPALPTGSDLISFRLMTDPVAEFDGWHVKNVQLNGVDLGTPGSLAGWDNQQFFNPQELSFYLTVVGINGTVDGFGDVTAGTNVVVLRPTLGAGNDYTLTAGDLAALAGSARVFAIVAGIPDAEESTLYQPYSLVVDGAEKADGQNPTL